MGQVYIVGKVSSRPIQPFNIASFLSRALNHPFGTVVVISRARSFDLEVTPWAPTRLASCIFHSGHTGAYEPLRSTRSSACAPFRDLAAPESTRKPPVCRSGISRARSFDLEVTP